jgi:hypothetical protein
MYAVEAAIGMDRRECRAMLGEEWGECITRERRSQLLTMVFGAAFKQGACSAGEFRKGGPSELSVTRAPSPLRPPKRSGPASGNPPVRRSRREVAFPDVATTAQAPAEDMVVCQPLGGGLTLPVALPVGSAPLVPVLRRCRPGFPTPNPPQHAQRAPSVSPPPKRVSFTAEALAKPPKPRGEVCIFSHPDPERHSRPASEDPTPYAEDGIIVSPGGGRLAFWADSRTPERGKA